MAIDLVRLRSIARGEITPKNGVAGVAGVADVARYASKSPELRQLRPLRVKNAGLENDANLGVAEGVASALRRPPEPRDAIREGNGAGQVLTGSAPGDVRKVVMSIPAGDDAWRVAGDIIAMVRRQDAAGDIPLGRSYRFDLTGDGDGGPDPRCDCGEMATYATSDARRPRGERWVCWECFEEWRARRN